MRTRLFTLLFVGAMAVPSLGWAAPPPAPEGYQQAERTTLARGVEHLRLIRPGEQTVNVSFIDRDAEVSLRTVPAVGPSDGTTDHVERTSSICRRVGCIAAINGDFFPDGVPIGAVASGGELLRSPTGKHHLLMIDAERRIAAGQLDWNGKLVSTDLQELTIAGVNVPRNANQMILYTPPHGPTTLANEHGAEMELRFTGATDHRPRLGETAIARMVRFGWGTGDSAIPADGAVLSAHGKAARALRDLWERGQRRETGRDILVRIDAEQQVTEAIGGSPILLRDGAIWFANEPRAFIQSPEPRTVVGWNEHGDTWLVAIDGRRPGYAHGMSLLEAAELLLGLGATDAINLDGGGSTTFVVGGVVANRPSDRLLQTEESSTIVATVGADVEALHVERPVANALVVVPTSADTTYSAAPALPGSSMADTVSLPIPAETDPASNPRAALPAIALDFPEPDQRPGRALPLTAAALLNLAVLIAVRARARPALNRP